MNQKEIKPIFIGQYIVIKRKNADDRLIIGSPALQSSVALVLISDDAVGFACFDTFVDLERTLNKMIVDMKKHGKSDITAQLVGGMYGFVPYRYSAFSDNITDILNKNKISFEHKHYNFYYAGISIAALYFISNYLGYIGPRSISTALFLAVILYTTVNIAEAKIKNNLDRHYNVLVDIKSGNVTITKNDKETATQIISNISASQATFFYNRMKIEPFNENLKYTEIVIDSQKDSQKILKKHQ